MARKLGRCMVLALAVALMPPSSWGRATDAADQEYAVYAALLFPEHSDAENTVANASPNSNLPVHQRMRVDLQGIVPGPYTILLTTQTAEAAQTASIDRIMAEDFSQKNQSGCDLDAERFRSQIPLDKRSQVTFLSEEKRKSIFQAGGWEAFRRSPIGASGITRLSRAGFNADQTLAMVDIQTISDYEMGIGYRVMLKRAPGQQGWVMIEASVNRMF
jgi:hypothetical protein